MGRMWPKFPDICLMVEGKPQENLKQETIPTGDRTRTRYVRDNDVTPRPQQGSNSLYHHHQCVLSKGSPSLQALEPRLHFCRRQGFPLQTLELRLQFYQGWIGAVASRCFPLSAFRTPHSALSLSLSLSLSLASEQTLKDLKRSQEHQRGGEESIFS